MNGGIMMDDVNNIKYTNIKDPTEAEKAVMAKFDQSPFGHLELDKLLQPPPPNDSKVTQHELKVIATLPEDEAFVKRYDDIFDAYKQYYEEIGEDLPSKIVKRCIAETAPLILKLKYMYDRPRPSQLAIFYGIKIGKVYQLNSMRSPSYPSGHSTQAYYISNTLINQGEPQSLMKVAQNISRSRNIARAHYPSDSAAGRDLANILIKNRK